MKTCLGAAWAIRLWIVLVVGGTAFAGADDFTERLAAAERLHGQGQDAGAEKILLEALQQSESFQPDDPRKAIVLNNLGAVYHFMNKYPQAEQCYRRAIQIEREAFEADGDRPFRSIVNLAGLYVETGQYAKAERLGLASLAEHLPAPRRTGPDMARLLGILGSLKQRQRMYLEAAQHQEEALAIWGNVAPHSAEMMEALNNLGAMYMESGRNIEALSFYQRALAIGETALSPEDPFQATLLLNIGTCHFMVDGPASAKPFYKRALAIAETGPARESRLAAQILAFYAIALERTRSKGQAKEYRRRSEAILRTSSGADPLKYTVDLGELLRRPVSH